MLKRILKGILWFLAGMMGLLLLISVLVYVPAVQGFVKDKASAIVSDATGMRLSIDRFRLRFPLDLSVDNTVLVTPAGDTLLRAGEIRTRVALWPLFAGKIQVRELALREVGVHYADTLSAMVLRAALDEFSLENASLRLSDSRVDVSAAGLSRADVGLWLGEAREPDTVSVDSVPARWNIRLGRLDLAQVGFRMHTRPTVTELTVDLPSGRIDDATLDLGRQQAGVGLIRLERGHYAYLTDTTAVASPVEPEPEPDSASAAWNIRVDRLELAENAFRYGILNGQPQPGFDPNHIALENMNIDVREAYYRPGTMGASIRALAARERSGLEITRGEGGFSMDSTRIVLSGFELQTAHSSFSADAEAAAGLLTQQPDAPLSATLRADVSPLDLYYFMTPDPALRQALAGKMLRIGGDLSGTLAALDVRALTAEMPGHIDLRVSGQAARLTDPENMEAQARFSGTFAGLEFLRPLLPDSLRGRIGFPRRLTLDGSLAMAGETYVPDLRLTADSGSLALKGRVDLHRETYRAEVATADFPLDAFLPQDTLGRLSFRLTADGNSFDPRRDGAASDVRFALERFDFKQYTYHDITLDARLAEHRLAGRLASETDAAKFDFGLDGTLSAEEYAARLTGKLDTLDLHRLGFMPEPFDASLWIDASVAYRPDSAYRADLSLDSLRWRHGRQTDRIAPTSLQASADPRGLKAALRSGDLALDFNAPVSLDALLSGFTTAAELVMAQVDSADINMTPVQEALPEFTLTVRARRENILHTLLQDSGLDFGQVNLRLTTVNENPLRLAFVVNSLKTAGLTLDTLNVGFWRKDEQLNYFVRLANRPGNIEQMALIALAGNVHGNQARLNVFQRDRTDSVGFRFGLTAELLDSAVRVRMNSVRPIFGYIPWTVNDDNYMVYHFDQRLDADLRLEGPASGQYFRLRSASLPTLPTGGARLELARIDVGGLLSLLPSPPPVGGELNSDIRFGFDQGQVVGVGTLGVDGLVYDKKRVGDIGLDVDFQSGEQQRFSLKGEATVDKQPVLTVNGTLRTGDDGDLTVRMNIPSFPLTAANAFLPEEQAQLTGALAGWLSLSGALSDPTVNGELRFNAGKISVPMLGTTYGLAAVPMKIASNRLDFNGFGLLSPNNQPLTLNGTLDFRDLSKMTADVSLRTQNFDVIHSSRDGGSAIYGRAPVDIGLTARGPVNALTVRGDIRLRRGTDVTYTLEDGPQEVESVKQNLVTFVDLNDPSTFEPADSTHRLAVFGMDMLVNINIEENVGVTVNISSDGSNRAEMSGAGNLTYTLNTQGDSRFTGRFDVSSGRILYSPPVIATKDFAIDEDSAVEWTGDMLNPAVDITAVSTVRTKVEFSDGSQDVNFQVMILIRNLLEELEVVFDLAAPNNLVITNDLRQMTAEQRMQQALNLLATGTYTGPSAKGKAIQNDPLNAFISRELNQWARNNLKGVDVSVGLDTVEGEEGTHTNYSYQVSKSFLDDRVKVTIGGSVNPEESGSQNLENSVVQDVSVEYRLTDRDNMFLRAFRNNTQESMLESEVVETGVAFVMRKRLNKLGDLFKVTPKEERRERRAIRRELREARKNPDNEQKPETTITNESEQTNN